MIDKYFKWQQHITYTTKKVRGLIYKFYILQEYINRKLNAMISKSLVESILHYDMLQEDILKSLKYHC